MHSLVIIVLIILMAFLLALGRLGRGWTLGRRGVVILHKFKDYWLLGLGIMLAAGEIPRIAGMFGLETSVRPNINGVINTAQSAVHLKQMVTAVSKK